MSNVQFYEETHTYTLDGKTVPSVTQVLEKHNLAPDLSMIPQSNLDKAAEHGTEVHSAIEDYIKNGTTSFIPEVGYFAQLCTAYGILPELSETVYATETIAGTVDVIGRKAGKTIIIDIKTGKKLYMRSYRWQLSLYKYLHETITGDKVEGLYIFHLTGDKQKVIEVDPIPEDKIQQLINAEKEDLYYIEEEVKLPAELLHKVEVAEVQIEYFKAMISQIEEQEKELKETLQKAMEEHGIKSYKTDKLSIAYVPPGERESFDSKRFKEDDPDTYKAYTKTVKVKPQVRIKVKENKDE